MAHDDAKCTMLKKAAIAGRPQKIEQLLLCGENPDAEDEVGRTALHWAAERGQKGAVEMLIKWMAQVDKQEVNGQTPLYLASWHGHDAVVELLTKSGADANIKRSFGATSLHIAAQTGHENVIRSLLRAGADSNLRRWDGSPPVRLAAQFGRAAALRIMLFEGNADPNLGDESRNTLPALFSAASYGHTEAIAVLLKAGADRIACNSALHEAAFFGREEAVKLLLQEGFDPCLKGEDGLTAAVDACLLSNCGVLIQLMQPFSQSSQLSDYPSKAAHKLNELLHDQRTKHESSTGERSRSNTTQDESNEETQSKDLHSALNSAGFVHDRARMQSALAEVLQSIESRRLDFGEFADHDVHLVGSFPEGWSSSLVRLDGDIDPDSDIDVTVIGRKKVIHFKGLCECDKSSGIQQTELQDGHVYWSVTSNNPAQSWYGRESRPAVDLVWAIRSCSYPPIELLQQQPLSAESNIDLTIIQDLKTMLTQPEFPCHLVTAASPGMDGNQLRVSTTFLERKLLRSLNDIQGQVFVLIKFIVKKVISTRVQGLKTYHAKNVLFYLMDETQTEDWEPTKLLHLTKVALKRLYSCLVSESTDENRLIKHFFMRDAWLYLKKGHCGKKSIASVVDDVINSLPDVLLQFKSNLRPVPSGEEAAFTFHPFLMQPVMKARSTEIDWDNIQYHELYDAVRSLLVRLSSDDLHPDQLQLLLNDASRIPKFAFSARQCLIAMALLKFGKTDEACKALRKPREHRTARRVQCPPAQIDGAGSGLQESIDYIWLQLETQDFAWKFCIEEDKELKFDFLLAELRGKFPVIFVYKNWHYVNFESLLKSLDIELSPPKPARALRAAYCEEVVGSEEPDVQDLLMVLDMCPAGEKLVRLIHKNSLMIRDSRILPWIVRRGIVANPKLISLCVEITAATAIEELHTEDAPPSVQISTSGATQDAPKPSRRRRPSRSLRSLKSAKCSRRRSGSDRFDIDDTASNFSSDPDSRCKLAQSSSSDNEEF